MKTSLPLLLLWMLFPAGIPAAQDSPRAPLARSLDLPIFTAGEGRIVNVAVLPEARIAVQVGPQRILLLNAAGTILDERHAEGLARIQLATDGRHFGRIGFREIPLTGEIVQDSFTLLDERGKEVWTFGEDVVEDVTEFLLGPEGHVLGLVRARSRGAEDRILFFSGKGTLVRTVSLPYLRKVTFHDDGRKVLVQTRDRLVMLTARGGVDRELLPSMLAAASRDGEDLVLFRRHRLSILPSGVATLDLDFGDIHPFDLRVSKDGTRAVLLGSRIAVVVRLEPPGLAFTATPGVAGHSIRSVALQDGEDGLVAIGANDDRRGEDGAAEEDRGGLVILLDARGQVRGRWKLVFAQGESAGLPGVALHSDERRLLLWTSHDLYAVRLPPR